MRRKVIAGNWKMHKTVGEATALVSDLLERLKDELQKVEIIVLPPFTDLVSVSTILAESKIALGAQNLHWAASGAFTGEISAEMIKSTGAAYVVIGHSERRQHFGETDATVNKRLKAALETGLFPILCIGETIAQRQGGETEKILETQLRGALNGIPLRDMAKIIIAYEPVWAIGTGMNATPEQAEHAHVFIRTLIMSLSDADTAGRVRIQYGGSVKPDNAHSLLHQPNIDGALVGGASLDADSFVQIVKAAL